jgi:ABC-type glycerol-3-phosphate transport system permease component
VGTGVVPHRTGSWRHAARSWLTGPRVVFAAVAAAPFLFLAAFNIYPLLQQFYGSFYFWYQLRPSTFTALANYSRLLDDPIARLAALHTVIYVLAAVPCEVGLGLVAASLTLRASRGQAVLVALFILPLVVPWGTAADLFLALPQPWYDRPLPAFAILVVIGIWKGVPWCYLLLLGALSISPAEVFEAARIDGARGVVFWRRILIPAIRPMFVFVIVLRILAEAQNLTSVALLTSGGPSFTTQLSSYYGFELGFSFFQFGEAAALGTLLGAALLIVAVLGWRFAWARPARRASMPSLPRIIRRSPRPRAQARAGTVRRLRWGPAHSIAWGNRGRWLFAAVLVMLMLAPFAGVVGEWSGYTLRWQAIDFGLRNSAIVTGGTLSLTLLLAVPAAYLLARKRFWLNDALFLFVLFNLAIPGVVIILPQVEEMSRFGLVNSYLGLIILYSAANLPLAVFFLRPAFASVPEPLIESMQVDGAQGLVIVRRLLLPYVARTIIAVALLVVIWVWNELPLAVVMINSQSLQTLPVLVELNVGGSASVGASWISMAPPLLLFLATLRYFRRGVITGNLL